MGSTSYMGKSKTGGYRAKSGSSIGSDKDMNGKLRRPKIRRPTKLNDYGLKRIPDYTELAYKEAVSKLRYFLPGNYAPLPRSYVGSPSIKNLDESDADLDKKYSYSLAEYKPRPRLTAKYTTLYADSLNNTYPSQHHVTNTTAPTAATGGSDLAGGTNPDVINFIQKQEEYIEQLERESQYCRDELNNLLGKVKEVISENENLHEAQKNKMISRMFHSYQGGSETDELDDFADSTGLDSDNKVSPSKARRTKSRSTRLEGPNIVFESRIAELEAQLTQSKIDLKKIQEENNENKRKLASGLVDSTCLDGFKRQIDNLQRDKSSLESQISKLKMTLEQKDEDGKYRRGSDVVEQQLREERNTLEGELRRLKDELASERGRVRELAGEGARRAVAERSAAEQRYTAHFDELQRDLAAQYDNVAKLQLDLERQRREENDLKRELSMKNSAIEELKMELKNKTASLQADLAQAHAEKASLEEELASARLAIERHQRQAKHESNRLNSEIQSLRQRLDRADADLVHSRRENLRLSDQISTLEKELNMRSLTPISPEKKKDKEKELSSMFESMENKHAKTVVELESMIQSQNSLMEKLTDECRLLTDKLDDANRRHKNELATLQRQVDVIGRSMHQDTTPSTYQAHATHETPTSRVGHEPLSDARPDHSRDDPTRYTTPGRTEPEGYGASRPFSRRESKQSLNEPIDALKDMPNTVTDNTEKYQELQPDYSTENYEANDQKYQDPERDIVDTEYDNSHVNIPENRTDVAQFEPSNDDVQIDNRHDNLQYEQNADNVQYDQGAEYQNQTYEQPYDASTGQYENYEQYPQQYTDPNTQYGEQYNYNVDGNYQEQNYDNTQYQQDYADNYQEQAPETQPATQTLPPTSESKRSNSPNEKPANRS